MAAPARSAAFIKKQWILFACSAVALLLYFVLPRNQSWFRDRVMAYSREFWSQKSHPDLEYRKQLRWQKSYIYASRIAAAVNTHQRTTAWVLVPHSSYFEKHGIDFKVPEPAVFYYYTELKTTQPGNRMAHRANWLVTVDAGRLTVAPLRSRQQLDSVLQQMERD